MSLNRTLAKAYADFFGFFWLPCPFPGCGEMYGGHEAGEYVLRNDPEHPYSGKLTCKRHNDENRKEVEAAGYEYVQGMSILRVGSDDDFRIVGASPHRLSLPEDD